VFVAMPSASPTERRRVLDACAYAAVRTRVVASPLTGSMGLRLADLKDVQVEDLLGREAVRIDTARITAEMADAVVAITGAAGSIGRELARQIVAADPARILLVDIDESRLYETYLELQAVSTSAPVMCVCDIRDERRLRGLFKREKPAVVLHAAAYKHVPVMELVPDEAIRTNVGGTANVVNASLDCGARRFVLISTDKAVEPRNIMGLTKYIAEMIVLEGARRGLGACAVRFGNVLGSRGSVVPIFEEQIRRGGPLRVTHADATRYFMTIPEAAGLVLEASTLSDGGEIFVLDMGEPVRILDLARKIIALRDPHASIDFIGLRPGEKLHEVLTSNHESLVKTSREKILRTATVPDPMADLGERVDVLVRAAQEGDMAVMLAALLDIVPDASWVRGHQVFRGVV
jgi:FlaA1/EpsC-like NDP-sugar epimerase